MGIFGGQRKRQGLYYLLPGMNRGNREKRRRILRWSVFVGVLVSGVFGLLLWLLNR